MIRLPLRQKAGSFGTGVAFGARMLHAGYPEKVTVFEVGPRDGLQNEPVAKFIFFIHQLYFAESSNR